MGKAEKVNKYSETKLCADCEHEYHNQCTRFPSFILPSGEWPQLTKYQRGCGEYKKTIGGLNASVTGKAQKPQ